MLSDVDWGTSIQVFLMSTTALFVLLCIVLLNRTKHLRRKVSDMLEAMAGKDKELNKAKAEAQNLLSPFIPETSRSVIISMDPTGKIIETNDYAAELFGYKKEELIGKNAMGLIFSEDSNKNIAQNNIISRILANPKLYVEHETENVKKSGEHLWISWTNRVIYDDSGKPTELRTVGFDITQRKRLEEELKYLASVDPQTGVLNRQALLEAGMHEVKRAQRYKRDLSVLIMRLDYFHDTSSQRDFTDDIIRKMIAMTRSMIRESDYIGRVGDIEFAILLPETSKEKALVAADRIKSKIEEESLKKSDGFFITIHFGVSEKESAKDTIDDMLLRALDSFQQQAQKRKTPVKPKKKKES